MSVHVRKSKFGEMRYIRYRDPDGKQTQKTLGLVSEGWTKQKALQEERRLTMIRVELVPPSPLFKEVAWDWFEQTGNVRNWRPRTIRAYKRSIERLSFFHELSVSAIKPKHIQEWVSGNRYAAKTVNDDLSVLHGILEYARMHELIDLNPASSAPRPKITKKDWRILEPAEIRKVDEAFEDEMARLIFRLLVRTGIRRGELQNLKIRDVDLDASLLRITDSKTEEGIRAIALPASLKAELEEWVKGKSRESYLFPSSRGGKLSAQQWYAERFFKALKKAGITDYVRPFHDMRHTSLTNSAATGKANPVALMARAGHKNMKTTMQYLKLAGVVFPDEVEALDERIK